MLITEVHTGKTVGQGRKAILVVDEKVTKPGQLAQLTEFLRGKGLIAAPGYDDGHVLRVSNFDSDATLRQLLLEEFPATMSVQPEAGKKPEPLIDPNISFVPLDSTEKQPFKFKRFLTHYATPLAGGLSLISAGSLFAKDFSRFHNPENAISKIKSGVTGMAAIFFAMGSISLTALGISAARKPSVTELITSLEPQLNQDPAKYAPPKRTLFQRARDYAQNNPWRVNTAFNSIGALTKFIGHGLPGDRVSFNPLTLKPTEVHSQPEWMELVATTSGLASLSLIATASSGPADSILGIRSYASSRAASDPLDRQFGHVAKSFPSPFDPANDQGKSGHLNMKAAGMLSFISNALFGAKGLLDVSVGFRSKDPRAQHARSSWPMMLILPLDLTASYLTTLAKPKFSYSIDELATEMAAYIAHKLDLKHPDAQTITQQSYMLTELLGHDPRVTESPHQLREALAAQLEINYGYKMPSQGLGLKEYEHLLEISPFSPAKQPEKIVEKQKEGFVDRLKKQPIVPAQGMALA